MLRTIHFIVRNVPGCGPPDGRCLPCSGISGTAVSLSPCSSLREHKQSSKVKSLSLKSTSRNSFLVCNAISNSYRRNPEYSRHSKHGSYRGSNRQNDDRDSHESFEESEMFSSKNGPVLSTGNTPRYQVTATPGQREREIVELFRKVQAQLRERTMKGGKKNEDSRGKGKENETVDSLLQLLRKHSVQQGKRSSGSGSSRNFNLDQPEQSVLSEERLTKSFDSNSGLKQEGQENDAPVTSRPRSIFRRRSPVPQVKFQPVISSEEPEDFIASTSIDGKSRDKSLKADPDPIPEFQYESESESDGDSVFSDTDVFDELSDDGTSERYGDDDGEDDNQVEHTKLSEMKISELRALAKSQGLKGYSKMNKTKLIKLLSESRV